MIASTQKPKIPSPPPPHGDNSPSYSLCPIAYRTSCGKSAPCTHPHATRSPPAGHKIATTREHDCFCVVFGRFRAPVVDTGALPIESAPGNCMLIPMGISDRTLLTILLLGLACIDMSRASGAEPLYSRGYIDALVDSRFPGLGLRVQAIDANQVTLSTRICLGPWQKRDIVSLVKEVKDGDVIWAEPALCSPPKSGKEQSAAPDSTAKEIAKTEAIPSTYALPEQNLFAPLSADPRQPRFSLSYQRYRISGQKFAAANVA